MKKYYATIENGEILVNQVGYPAWCLILMSDLDYESTEDILVDIHERFFGSMPDRESAEVNKYRLSVVLKEFTLYQL